MLDCVSHIVFILLTTECATLQMIYIWMFHMNICSFNANSDEFLQFLDTLVIKPYIIFLSETWFDGIFHPNIIGYHAYHAYRTDKRGGGVSIYVSEKFKSSALNHLTTVTDDIETCAVRISVSPRVSLDIIGLYRPPRGNPIEFNNKLNQMTFDNNSSNNSNSKKLYFRDKLDYSANNTKASWKCINSFLKNTKSKCLNIIQDICAFEANFNKKQDGEGNNSKTH